MAKLHHTQLKAAVSKYGALLGTMSDEALKAEIAKDEKLTANVDEVFAAISSETKGNGNPGHENNSGNNNTDTEIQPEAFNEEALKGFIDSLTDDQAQKVYNAVAEKLGTDKIDWDHLHSLQSKIDQAAKNPQAESKKADDGEHFVVTEFGDINDFTIRYKKGQNVDHLPAKRLAELIEKGLVEKQ